MNYKNYFFSFLVIFCFAVTADEPVGSVQSENASQRSGQVSVTDQSMEVRSVGGIEEVVVTAQKREQSLQDTPIALTAITASTIDDLDIKNSNFTHTMDNIPLAQKISDNCGNLISEHL